MRHKHWGIFTDGDGKVVGSATTSDSNAGTVSVYLAGTTTAADVYAASSGGAAVNSVSTDEYGYFCFWVDDFDYPKTQLFKIILSHADFQSKTYDNISVISDQYVVNSSESDQGAASTEANKTVKDLVDGIGSSKYAKLSFPHDGSGNQTTYTLTTSETIPSNLSLDIEPGSIIDGAGTLTINGVINDGLHQKFGTNITIDGTPKIKYIYPQWFGATGDGSTDDTNAIQAALDMANNLDASATTNTVVFPYGTYKITSTLTWYKGTCLEGIHNASDVGPRWPEIAWFGAASGTMIQTDSGLSNRHIKHIRRLVLRNGSGHTDYPNIGVHLQDRADLGTTFRDFQVVSVDNYGIYFEGGGINVHLTDVRFDGCVNSAIGWDLGGHDSLSIDKFTIDNQRDDQPASGGVVEVDMSSASNNEYIDFTATNGKIEANTDLSSGDGFFKFIVNPDLSQKEQVRATLSNVWVAAAGGVTENDGIVVTPAFDFVKIVLINCWRFSVVGIPSFNNALATSEDHALTVIAPHSFSINSSPAAEQSMNHFNADSDFHQIYQFGEKTVSTLYKEPSHADWDSNPHTVYAGQWFVDPAEIALSVRHVDEVTATGTLGTLSGVTGTGSTGTATLTLNDVSDLKIGHVISIGADTGKRIFHINATTGVVTLHSNLANTHSGAAVSFTAPTTQSHQLLVTAAAAPAAGTYVQGDVVFNSGATAGGTVGWVCTTGGTPGTWKAFGDIAA